MKIALGQINTKVGALRQNVDKMLLWIDRAKAEHAHLIAFPELSITGYPPKDLIDASGFLEDNLKALHAIADQVQGITVVLGFAEPNPGPTGKGAYNSAAVIRNRKVISIHRKSLLPTYDVFDEARYFEPSNKQELLILDEQRIGLTICEDVWNDKDYAPRLLYHLDPVQKAVESGAEFIINISSSPYHLEKWDERHQLLRGEAMKYRKHVVYVNLVGGNDELIFDGRSVVFSPDGEMIARAKDFEEDLLFVDFDSSNHVLRPSSSSMIENAKKALILGTRDYVHKCGFTKVLLGLSGGIDSAVTCAMAVEAVGAENVLGVLMPSQYSSDHSVSDALQLAKNLRIRTETIPISNIFDVYRSSLAPIFRGAKEDITEENLQARIRGNLLMALSNKYGMLLLSTGNKSELAVGYTTLYGDACGGLAVISDVPKTMVYELAEHMNAEREIIPRNTITKPPSAELRPGQKDSDSLPEYDVLDKILVRYIEDNLTADQIVEQTGFNRDLVLSILRKVDSNEYKRKQLPIGLKITTKAFGFGRRWPIAQGYKHEF
ncbi:MAG: NAD+ synthase [Acidobacteria bacterium]|nr:MAG: NAD+ synthase [Acidobacteriota bacterium]